MSKGTAIHDAKPESNRLRARCKAKTLHEQSLLACRTAETKRKSNCSSVAQNKNGQRQDNQPRPARDENHDHAKKNNCEPTTRPHDEPRFRIQASAHWPLDR